MLRISTHMSSDDMQYHLRLRQSEMNRLENQIAEQTRIQELRDDPVAAAHSTKYQSHIARLERFVENGGKVQDRLAITEQYLQSGNEILQRIRELTVQGANGTYTGEQKKMMAVEMNELLNEFVEIANARSGDGTALFAGDANSDRPFSVLTGNIEGADGRLITSVRYNGGAARNAAEISEGSYIASSVSGGDVFWAENQEIMTDVDAAEYVVRADSFVLIDGVQVDLKAGDNVYAIMAKINDSDAAVKASLDPVNNSLTLISTYPHQMRIEDGQGGTVLQDLGVLSGIGSPPYNYASEARVSGGSAFDMIIYVRDRLFEGETINVGGAGLKGIDKAHQQLLSSLADLGTRSERLGVVESRLNAEIPEMMQQNSREVDLDLTQALVDLKELEYAHTAALQTASQILQPTLLDFLR